MISQRLRKTMLGVLVGSLCLSACAHVAESTVGDTKMFGVPSSLADGDSAYKEKGADAFFEALLKDSYPDDSPNKIPMLEKAQAFGQLLQQVELLYGRYKGMELVGTLPITKSTRTVFYVLNYERGPVYGVLTIFRTDAGEVVTGYAINTEALKVVPPTLLVDRMQLWSDKQ